MTLLPSTRQIRNRFCTQFSTGLTIRRQWQSLGQVERRCSHYQTSDYKASTHVFIMKWCVVVFSVAYLRTPCYTLPLTRHRGVLHKNHTDRPKADPLQRRI